MILDYSEFLEDTHTSGIGGIHHAPENEELFFKQRGWCPFCQVSALKVHNLRADESYPREDLTDDPAYDPPGGGDIEQQRRTDVWSCLKCGWWEAEHNYSDDWIWIHAIRHAILRSFNPSDVALPVASLQKYLVDRPETIYEIAPRKMEELVQSVFKEFFDCEVIHCGRSRDRGIDLILVISDIPSVIQVKRRIKANTVESVDTVRNLLGATLLQQMRRAMIVTTADHFSNQAYDEAGKAIAIGLVQSFDLIDAHRFFSMLRLLRTSYEELWRKHIW